MVEIKGYSAPLLATRFFFTSNVNPKDWYPEANEQQTMGLMRRVNITHMIFNWEPIVPNTPIEEMPSFNVNEFIDSIDDIFSDI